MEVSMSPQEQAWSGEFGNAYTNRNRVDWRARIPFWTQVINETGARSVYEFGCNSGWNLSAIRRAFPDVQLAGEDINPVALQQCALAGFAASVSRPGMYDPEPRELAFTAGVLIHIAPSNRQAFMQRVIDASARWVLAIEYASDEEQEIDYRGQRGLLWKGSFGKHYEALGLKLLAEWEAKGFDRCTAWLLEKP
jgi:spore coat polysaccharide biosynthesis protein SpsF